MDVDALLTKLLARMPELEWQLNKQASFFSPKSLPRGLFRQHYDAPTKAYIDEIKADIATLADARSNQRIVRYLALKINQKINVLVAVCTRYNRLQPQQEPVTYGVDKLTTRQEWLQSLEFNIQALTEQQQALDAALQQKDKLGDTVAILTLNRELGELEKRITLAKETYARATGPIPLN